VTPIITNAADYQHGFAAGRQFAEDEITRLKALTRLQAKQLGDLTRPKPNTGLRHVSVIAKESKISELINLPKQVECRQWMWMAYVALIWAAIVTIILISLEVSR
jgi:hypothetical protein